MQVGGDRHPVAGIGTARGLTHPPDPLAGRDGGVVACRGRPCDLGQVGVERVKDLAAARPAMADHEMPAVIRHGRVIDSFDDPAVVHRVDFVVRHEHRFVARIFRACRAVGELDRGCAAGRGRVDRGDVTAAMPALAAVAGPAGPAVIRVDPGAGKVLFRLRQQQPVRCWPTEPERFAIRQRLERGGRGRHYSVSAGAAPLPGRPPLPPLPPWWWWW